MVSVFFVLEEKGLGGPYVQVNCRPCRMRSMASWGIRFEPSSLLEGRRLLHNLLKNSSVAYAVQNGLAIDPHLDSSPVFRFPQRLTELGQMRVGIQFDGFLTIARVQIYILCQIRPQQLAFRLVAQQTHECSVYHQEFAVRCGAEDPTR